jgi:thiol-disulfide isomerase/thioredoxin
VVLEVFGSWCPNCNDASAFLVELDRKYRGQGVAVVALAFELTGDKARDAKQLETYIAHHNIGYPVLLAGVADTEEASKRLPMIDKLRAFPTTIFIDRGGRVRAVHTGFSGPATGVEYAKLRSKFESILNAMLAED